MEKFVIPTRENNEYQFNLIAANGSTILSSEGYKSKVSCNNGIESVKKNSGDNTRFDRKKSGNGKCYFNLKAGNEEVIGSSEIYESSAGMENGIKSVKTNAADAQIVESSN